MEKDTARFRSNPRSQRANHKSLALCIDDSWNGSGIKRDGFIAACVLPARNRQVFKDASDFTTFAEVQRYYQIIKKDIILEEIKTVKDKSYSFKTVMSLLRSIKQAIRTNPCGIIRQIDICNMGLAPMEKKIISNCCRDLFGFRPIFGKFRHKRHQSGGRNRIPTRIGLAGVVACLARNGQHEFYDPKLRGIDFNRKTF